MPGRPQPLLCELHAHSTWTDGSLSVPQLVDLYGGAGFDVLAVTDHACRTGDEMPRHVPGHLSFVREYLDEMLEEAERADVRPTG